MNNNKLLRSSWESNLRAFIYDLKALDDKCTLFALSYIIALRFFMICFNAWVFRERVSCVNTSAGLMQDFHMGDLYNTVHLFQKHQHCAKKPVTTMLTIPLEMYSFTL